MGNALLPEIIKRKQMRQQRKSQFQAFYKQSEIQETQLSDSMFLPSIPF